MSLSTDKSHVNIDWSSIEDGIKESVSRLTPKDQVIEAPKPIAPDAIQESYVAEPKSYSQVSEFVSQRTKDAHTKLYQEYVETLNRVSAELDTAKRSESNNRHSEFKSLKCDESHNLNGVWLHELYFANCFDPHSEVYMDSMSYLRMEREWGTFEDWQKDAMACAMAAEQGWFVCGYNMYLKRYVNLVVNGNDCGVMMGVYPLVVIDMHEHSYHKDYQTDVKSYLVAMMRQLNWNVIEERMQKAESIAQVLK